MVHSGRYPDEFRNVEVQPHEKHDVFRRAGALLVEDADSLQHFRGQEPCPVGAQKGVDAELRCHVGGVENRRKTVGAGFVGQDRAVCGDLVMAGANNGIVLFVRRVPGFEGCGGQEVIWVGKADGFASGRPYASVACAAPAPKFRGCRMSLRRGSPEASPARIEAVSSGEASSTNSASKSLKVWACREATNGGCSSGVMDGDHYGYTWDEM